MNLYQPDSLIAMRERELEMRAGLKREGPLVQLTPEELLLHHQKTLQLQSSMAGPSSMLQHNGKLIPDEQARELFLANSLLSQQPTNINSHSVLPSNGKLIPSQQPLGVDGMYRPNSLLSQQSQPHQPLNHSNIPYGTTLISESDVAGVASGIGSKKVQLTAQPEFFGANSLLAHVKASKEQQQHQKAVYYQDGPLLGKVDKEEKKVKLEGGLLGEMNRREKEREYLKKMGMYQSLQPTALTAQIPPHLYPGLAGPSGGMMMMPPTQLVPPPPQLFPPVALGGSSPAIMTPQMQMQLQMQQMQMQMQMMQMHMGMATASPIMMNPAAVSASGMAPPVAPLMAPPPPHAAMAPETAALRTIPPNLPMPGGQQFMSGSAQSDITTSEDPHIAMFRHRLREQYLEKER